MSEVKSLMTMAPSCSHLIQYLSNHNWGTLIKALNKYDHVSRGELTDYQLLCRVIGLIRSLEKGGACLDFILSTLRIKHQDYIEFNDFCYYDAKYIDLVTIN